MDIEIARKLIEESDMVFAAVKDGRVTFTSKERGIKPALEFFSLGRKITKGASIADRVVGKGAAMLLSLCYCREIYSPVISRDALTFLEGEGQSVVWATIVPYIINFQGNGRCPVEELLLDTDDPFEGVVIINKFLQS